MNELAGRCAVITGGAGGIGLSIANAFGVEGMQVAIADIDSDRSQTAARALREKGFDAQGFDVDVGDPDSVTSFRDSVAETYDDVAILCANAGVTILHQPFMESTPDDWRFLFTVNVLGTVNCLQAFLPGMIASKREHHVVTTASMSGIRPSRASSVYIASKYAVVGLSEKVRLEVEQFGIGVSLLLPGALTTDLANTSERARDLARGSNASKGGLDPIDAERDPDFVGALVVQGVQQNLPYIVTHPDLLPQVEEHNSRLEDAFGLYPQGAE